MTNESTMTPDSIESLRARSRLVALQARLIELCAQEAHTDAVRRLLRIRLRQHQSFATRSSMSITEADLAVLLDALDRADVDRRAVL